LIEMVEGTWKWGDASHAYKCKSLCEFN
jgi:hypothetical protein